MRRLAVVVLGCFVAVGVSLLAQTPGPLTPAHEIHVTAKKYEFSPSTITVNKGELVKLTITALDHDHGFRLEAFNIDKLPVTRPLRRRWK